MEEGEKGASQGGWLSSLFSSVAKVDFMSTHPASAKRAKVSKTLTDSLWSDELTMSS